MRVRRCKVCGDDCTLNHHFTNSEYCSLDCEEDPENEIIYKLENMLYNQYPLFDSQDV